MHTDFGHIEREGSVRNMYTDIGQLIAEAVGTKLRIRTPNVAGLCSADGPEGINIASGRFSGSVQRCGVHGAGTIRPRAKSTRGPPTPSISCTKVMRPSEKVRGCSGSLPVFRRRNVTSEPSGIVTYARCSSNATLNLSSPQR